MRLRTVSLGAALALLVGGAGTSVVADGATATMSVSVTVTRPCSVRTQAHANLDRSVLVLRCPPRVRSAVAGKVTGSSKRILKAGALTVPTASTPGSRSGVRTLTVNF